MLAYIPANRIHWHIFGQGNNERIELKREIMFWFVQGPRHVYPGDGVTVITFRSRIRVFHGLRLHTRGSTLSCPLSGYKLTMRQDSRSVITACGLASLHFMQLFAGLQLPDFADVYLLATGRLGPYPG